MKIPIVKSVAGDARKPFLYRTALWLRHRCVYDHPPTRHASSPPHASRTWRSPRRPLAVDGRDAVVFSARARVRVFHRSRSMARLPRDASRETRPSLGSIDTVDHLWTRSRRARRAARLASSSRDSRPERFRRKTRASWGHRGFFRVLPAFASLTRPRLPRSFSLPRPTDNHGRPNVSARGGHPDDARRRVPPRHQELRLPDGALRAQAPRGRHLHHQPGQDLGQADARRAHARCHREPR